MVYINTKNNYGVETIDQIDPGDFPTRKEYRKEIKNCMDEYRLIYSLVYLSQRCDKTWKR